MKKYLGITLTAFFILISISSIYGESSGNSVVYTIELYQNFLIQTEDQVIGNDSPDSSDQIHLNRITDTIINMKFEVLNISAAPNLGIAGDIDQIVAQAIFMNNISFDDYFENFVQQYYQTMNQNPEMRSQSGWFDERTLTVEYNANFLLSLGLHYFSFVGGAHPSHSISYRNFDLESGDSLTLKNILNTEGLTGMNDLGEEKFRNLYDIPSDTSINDYGFWFDQDSFYLNENFYFDSTGMHFLYNPYEIACYACGYTQLDFSWEELKGLTDSNSIIYSIINKIIEQ